MLLIIPRLVDKNKLNYVGLVLHMMINPVICLITIMVIDIQLTLMKD